MASLLATVLLTSVATTASAANEASAAGEVTVVATAGGYGGQFGYATARPSVGVFLVAHLDQWHVEGSDRSLTRFPGHLL